MHTLITNKSVRFSKVAMLFGVLLFFVVPSAGAAPLSVEPTVTRMTVLPGWEWLGSVRVTNPGDDEVRVEIDSINLISGTEPDDPPVPVLGESSVEREVSLAGWFRLPIQQIRIAPNSTVEIPIVLVVPPYAGHGEHRAAISFRQEGVRPEGGGVQVAATIVSGFLVDVLGNENSYHEIELASFETNTVLTTRFPVDLRVRVQNNGTTLGVLDGQVTVSSVLGRGGVQFPVATADEGRYLKPGSSYENTFTLTDDALGSGAGVYRASIKILNGGDVLEKTTTFVVVPMPLAVILLSTLFISVGGVRFAIRKKAKRAQKA